MLQIRQGFDGLVRTDEKVKANEVIPSGACCKLDSNREVVLTGTDASAEDFVFFAFNNANITDDINSAFKLTGKITLLALTPFIGETDQYLTSGTYAVGTKLATENGKLMPAATGDYVIGRALGAPVSGVLRFTTIPKYGVA